MNQITTTYSQLGNPPQLCDPAHPNDYASFNRTPELEAAMYAHLKR